MKQKEFTELKATFKSGDLLVLSLSECKFATFKSGIIYQLTYVEKSTNEVGEFEYTACNTEYFPNTRHGMSLAKQAFNIRLNCNNPSHESDQGYSLDKIFELE